MKMGKNEVAPFGEKIKSSVLEILSLRCLLDICISYFFALCNKLPEVQWLKIMPIYEFTVLQVRSHGWVLGSGFLRLKSKCPSGVLACRLWGAIRFQAHFSCQQNSASCGCRTEILVSLLTVRCQPLSTTRGHSEVFAPRPFPFSTMENALISFMLNWSL